MKKHKSEPYLDWNTWNDWYTTVIGPKERLLVRLLKTGERNVLPELVPIFRAAVQELKKELNWEPDLDLDCRRIDIRAYCRERNGHLYQLSEVVDEERTLFDVTPQAKKSK
ncbi:MAG TPA: hypothetical protein VMH89_11885 [Candidatus Acidoferrum sp.]|nr:hypothetical protein [Candidatus Acidoferrum sp.]